jgi:hypothetical protein
LRKSDGSIIFLILIAIFLFGALTYMYLKSSRTTDYLALEEDKAALYASEIVNYANALKEGVNRMKLLHGVDAYQIDYYANAENYVLGNNNANCTSNKCRLFHPEGGAVKPRIIDKEFYDLTTDIEETNVFQKTSFWSVAIEGVGTDADDIVLTLFGIHPEICKNINKKFSDIEPSVMLPQIAYGSWIRLHGNINQFPDSTYTINDALYAGHKTFCVGHSNHNQVFVHVLVER